MIHLDTNATIALLNQRAPRVRENLNASLAIGIPLFLSAIVFHELLYGAAYSGRREANENKIALFIAMARVTVLPFTDAEARDAADIRAHLRRLAEPIGTLEVLIAAQARRAGALLVTANLREFRRVPGLTIENWAV